MNMGMPSLYENISSRLSKISADGKKLPKYLQLSEAILALIDEGELKPGDHLPTESLLSEKLPYSLGTVQKSLRNLSELGVIERTRRRGTIVSERSSEIFALWQFRFISEEKNRVYRIFSRIIEMDRFDQTGPWSKFLGKDGSFIRIVREIDIDHRFKTHCSFYLSFDRFGEILDLNPSDLEGAHLSAVVQRMFGITTVRTKNQVVCSVIPDPVCLRLGLPSAARGLVCDVMGYGDDDRPLTFQRVYVPADAPPMEFHEVKPAWTSPRD